jgi:hypothetical protein
MTKLLSPSPAAANARLQSELFDDFVMFTDTACWTRLVADAGSSVALQVDGQHGVIRLTTGATDNNEAMLYSPEIARFAANRTMHFEALVQYAEAATNAANVLVGMMDAPVANSLVDNGGGAKASYSGAVFLKVDGGTRWICETAVGSSKTTTITAVTAGGATPQRLEIDVIPVSSTVCDVIFKIDGLQCVDANGTKIKHTVAFGSATEMAAAFGVKAGSASSEVLSVDYCLLQQRR